VSDPSGARNPESRRAHALHADQQELLRQARDVRTDADRQRALRKLSELQTRLCALQSDTRILADEADQLTWGRGEHATPWTRTGDASGYHQALDGLAAFEAMLSREHDGLKQRALQR